MKIRTLKIFLRDAIYSIWRNSWMSIASVSSVVAVLVLMGIVLIFMTNIQHTANSVEDSIELKAFLDIDVEEEQFEMIEEEIVSYEKIKSITFESKEQALENFSEQLGDRQDLIGGLEENNPLPNSFVISINNPEQSQEVADYISQIEGIEEVKYGEEIVDRLLQATAVIRTGTILLTVILAGISVFIISNTIKITVFSREREINIMKYVGATNWFVRWPFIIEGAVLGVIGSIFSILILGYAYYYIIGMTQASALSLISDIIVPPNQIMNMVTSYFLLAGLLIGVFGSILSMRRFLRV